MTEKQLVYGDRLLVKLLAAAEAAWLPCRDWRNGPAVAARRRGEVAVRPGGGGGAERQRFSRQLGGLREDELIIGHDKLTQAGKRRARQFTWPYSVALVRKALRRMQEAIDAGDILGGSYAPLAFVPEQTITGEFWGRQNGHLQAMLLPLLADQFLESGADVGGFVYYRFPAEPDVNGMIAASLGSPRRHYLEAAADVYDAELRRHRNVIAGDGSAYSEIGPGPLGGEPIVSEREDFSGVPILFPGVPRA